MWRWALLAVAAADDAVKIELTEAGDAGARYDGILRWLIYIYMCVYVNIYIYMCACMLYMYKIYTC